MIELTDEMKTAINNALMDRVPIVVAYVDSNGQPGLGFRGSTHVHGHDQLAMWIRNPEGGIVRAVQHNPRLALLYRNPETRVAWQFQGRAYIDEDPSVRERVYANSPEVERNLDPERAGKAIIIDLDRIIHRNEVIQER